MFVYLSQPAAPLSALPCRKPEQWPRAHPVKKAEEQSGAAQFLPRDVFSLAIPDTGDCDQSVRARPPGLYICQGLVRIQAEAPKDLPSLGGSSISGSVIDAADCRSRDPPRRPQGLRGSGRNPKEALLRQRDKDVADDVAWRRRNRQVQGLDLGHGGQRIRGLAEGRFTMGRKQSIKQEGFPLGSHPGASRR